MDSAPILQPPNNLPKKLNDCYFFYYSTCKNGDLCQFRHEASALGCEITCLFWKQGKCLNSSCNLRHMELRDRKMIQCYWEDQPSGCQKPHCPFRHKNPKLTAFDLANSVGLFNHNFLNNTTYQDLNASALSELSAVLGTSSLGLEGNLLLPLATSGLSANETKIVDSKQRELDKIRMEKVLEKAKEIERQISIFEKDDNDANTKTEGSDTKVTEKVAENKRIKRSSSEKKSSSRKRSRSVSRSRSRSRHRSTSSYRRRSRSPSRHNRSKSRRRTRSRSRSRRYRSRSNDRHRSRSIRRSRTRSRTRSCTPYYKLKIRKEYSDSKVSSTSFNNIDHFVHEQELCS